MFTITIRKQNEVVKEIHQFTGSQSNSSTDRILVVTADKENVDNYFVQYASRYYLWDVNVDARENFVTADQEFLGFNGIIQRQRNKLLPRQ